MPSVIARGAAISVLVALAAAPVAAEPVVGWAEPDPAAVIGRWRGAASWRGCVAGSARVVLDVARDGSGYGVELGPALDGLGAIALVPVGARRLEATRNDLTVRWTTGKPGRATLDIRFASGCAGVLRLTRDSTGAAACDELRALETIRGGCAAATSAPIAPAERAVIDDVTRGGSARARAARTCARLVPPLRLELEGLGCVPPPSDGAPGVRIPECEVLLTTVARLMRCDRVPADVKQRLGSSMQRVARWSSVAPGTDEAELRARAATTCAETERELAETIALVGCAP